MSVYTRLRGMSRTGSEFAIRPADDADAAVVAEIYNPYILETVITFEEEPVSGAQIAERMAECRAAKLPWLIAERNGSAIGYAYASRWKGRCSYRYSAEVTVYLRPENTRQGAGTELYRRLFSELKALGMHLAIGGITLPNSASVRLHEKFGMRKVAHFQEVGFKFERWLDVGYWQVEL